MQLFKRKNPADNIIVTVRYLLRLLNIDVSKSALRQITEHPKYPSISSISDCLNDWNIESMAVKLIGAQLQEIPYPAIAYLHKNNGHFVVLERLVGDEIKYFDSEIGLIEETRSEFEKKWTGITLLLQVSEKSGEEDYSSIRRAEIFEVIRKLVVGCVAASLICIVTSWIPLTILPVFILKLIGLALCLVLFQKQMGVSNRLFGSICKIGKQSDCDAVINSPASIIFGEIHLSELGLLYFAGGLTALSISDITNHYTLNLLWMLNWLTLPFTFFSVYYQWSVIRKWCPLCLLVMGVFWLEFFMISSSVNLNTFSLLSFSVLFVCFSMPLIFWLTVRKEVLTSFSVPILQRKLNLFLKNTQIFQSLLKNQGAVVLSDFKHHISAGPEAAKIELTIISNPTCIPCSVAHSVVHHLLTRFPEKVKVNYLFMVNLSDEESISTKMVKHLVALSIRQSKKETINALANWYLEKGSEDFKKWTEAFPILDKPDDSTINSIIKEQIDWCRRSGISVTPTVFIGDRRLPEEYSILDLKFQIKQAIIQS